MNRIKKISSLILVIGGVSTASMLVYNSEINNVELNNKMEEVKNIKQKDDGEMLDSSIGEIKMAKGVLSYNESFDNFDIYFNDKKIFSLNCGDDEDEEFKKNRVDFSCFTDGYEIYQVRKINDEIVFIFNDEKNENIRIIYFNDKVGLKKTEMSNEDNSILGAIIYYGKNLINNSSGIKIIYTKSDKLFIELNNDKENNYKYQYYYYKGIIYPDFDKGTFEKRMENESKILKNDVYIERKEKSVDLESGKLTIVEDELNVMVYLNQKLVDKFELLGSAVKFFLQKDNSFFLVKKENTGTTGIGRYEVIEYTSKAVKQKSESISQDFGGDAGAKITLLTDGLELDWGISPDGIHYIDYYKNGKFIHKKIIDSEKQEEAILEQCTQQHEFIVQIYRQSYTDIHIDWTDIGGWSIASQNSEPKIIWKDKKLYDEYIKIIRNAMNSNIVSFDSFREKFCRGDVS